jgi:hypothetical protein
MKSDIRREIALPLRWTMLQCFGHDAQKLDHEERSTILKNLVSESAFLFEDLEVSCLAVPLAVMALTIMLFFFQRDRRESIATW